MGRWRGTAGSLLHASFSNLAPSSPRAMHQHLEHLHTSQPSGELHIRAHEPHQRGQAAAHGQQKQHVARRQRGTTPPRSSRARHRAALLHGDRFPAARTHAAAHRREPRACPLPEPSRARQRTPRQPPLPPTLRAPSPTPPATRPSQCTPPAQPHATSPQPLPTSMHAYADAQPTHRVVTGRPGAKTEGSMRWSARRHAGGRLAYFLSSSPASPPPPGREPPRAAEEPAGASRGEAATATLWRADSVLSSCGRGTWTWGRALSDRTGQGDLVQDDGSRSRCARVHTVLQVNAASQGRHWWARVGLHRGGGLH